MTYIHNIMHGNVFNFFIYFVLSCMLKDDMRRLYRFIHALRTQKTAFLFYSNISLSSVVAVLLEGKWCLVYEIHIGITAKVEYKSSFLFERLVPLALKSRSDES